MTAEPLSDEVLLSRLVSFDTTSDKSNREIAEFIGDYLDRPGERVTRHPTTEGAKLNLIVAAGPEDGSHGLVLSGHMGTVPAESEGWKSDPVHPHSARWILLRPGHGRHEGLPRPRD